MNRDGAGFLASWGTSIHLFIDHTELSVVGHGGSVLRIVPESLMGRSVESASIWVRQYGADKVEAGKRSIDHYRAAKMLGTEVLMTRISFLYPNRKDARFDIDSYVEEHMPLSIALLSAHPCFKRVSVERGVSGVAPGLGPAYVAVCHFLFESLNDFMAAVTLNLAALQAEKNYTDLEPTFQVSEVPICR